MRKLRNTVAFFCIFIVSFSVLAFNPPIITENNIGCEIQGIDKEESVRQPLLFKVKITNNADSDITGRLSVWMNDDWHVDDIRNKNLTVEAGKSLTLQYNASAGLHVHKALYPVHARFISSDKSLDLHPIAIFEAQVEKREKTVPFRTVRLNTGILPLHEDIPHKVYVEHRNKTRLLGINFRGSDRESRAGFGINDKTRGGETRRSINIHPPYKGGTGAIWADYSIAIPEGGEPLLSFHTAIRDSSPEEGNGSDGVEFKVFAVDTQGKAKELFSRFSASKIWEKAVVDLSAYAGQTITLRLWSGPGPHKNTSFDNAHWGDAIIKCGQFEASYPSPGEWISREITAETSAKEALESGSDETHGRFLLNVRGEKFGAAVIPGQQGLTDAVFAFTDGKENLLYRGFEIDIDKKPVGAVETGSPVTDVEYSSFLGKLFITHKIAFRSGTVNARATVSVDEGALRIVWDMPDVKRCRRGTPRYTRLGIGSCKTPLKRVYAGSGNVIEYPESFNLRASGFVLSTRHVGADYENGLSLLQASSVFPDKAVYEKERSRFALEAPHDSRFLLIPSAEGAFAAARAYRDICGFKRSPGWKRTAGRMCLDQWGGDYAKAAEKLKKAGKYGLSDSIFVKHVWQRWGYDYRLPEIFPPRGNMDDFMAMRSAAEEAGIIFAPHDNYTDFYPDAEGFSYDHIVFNEDGTPKKAWFNKSRKALSYRWLPHAFQPWMKNNMIKMKESFYPDSLFIDVFTASPPHDYYDREGNFHTRCRNAEMWGEAFNTCRRILKRGCPMISEAGHDALIGCIDASQADHLHAGRWIKDFKTSCRVPWHDMASHGRMILLAGGLGRRYSALNWSNKHGRPEHGYASDDYLCNTVIGGRNPMCIGPFSRAAVMTYWLLHDICDELAREEFESHEFGRTIKQQHAAFGKNGQVWINRGEKPWIIAGTRKLPMYGFYAENNDTRAGIIELDGQRAAFAQSGKAVFVDARPLFNRGEKVSAEVTEGRYLGNGRYSFSVNWEILNPEKSDYRPFLHFDHINEDLDKKDNIAFQRKLNFPLEKLNEKCRFSTTTTFSIPEKIKPGKYAIRFGFYNPKRMKIAGNFTPGGRVRGGIITVTGEDGKITGGSWKNEKSVKKQLPFVQRNTEGRILDFGSIRTDGAFRVVFNSSKCWTLIPLPLSRDFTAELDLKKLGAKSDEIRSVTVIDPEKDRNNKIDWTQTGSMLTLTADGHAFGYKIEFD
ncbi:MAG: hypothetical protein R6V06_08110 [Kiritimatiellia bacterium]